MLAFGKRTVSACLRITGRAMAVNCASCRQVLNRARWKPRELAGRFARVLVAQLVEEVEPIIIGLDDTIERRWGAHIRARGIYRDPVRSSRGHFVKTSGLRWPSFMLLTPLPRLPGCKALPILTVLAPSQRWALQQERRHNVLTDGARQGMLVILRWFPKRSIIFVGDRNFGTHELADAMGRHACLISRLRLDASLFAPPEPRSPAQRGRPRHKGKSLPRLRTHLHDPVARWTEITLLRWYGGPKEKTLEILSEQALWYRTGTKPKAIRWVLVRDPEGRRDPRAFFSTDPDMAPARIIAIFVRRWQIEVTFQEVRAHLGVETQRQWSDAAIERTTRAVKSELRRRSRSGSTGAACAASTWIATRTRPGTCCGAACAFSHSPWQRVGRRSVLPRLPQHVVTQEQKTPRSAPVRCGGLLQEAESHCWSSPKTSSNIASPSSHEAMLAAFPDAIRSCGIRPVPERPAVASCCRRKI